MNIYLTAPQDHSQEISALVQEGRYYYTVQEKPENSGRTKAVVKSLNLLPEINPSLPCMDM